jgi:LPXTG-site transpeptidase (sortase) family protein
MPSTNPALSFGRPLRPPTEFEPSESWTDRDYVYRYDAVRAICKRTPISVRVSTGTMFFAATAVPAAAIPTPRRRFKRPARSAQLPRAAALGYRATWLHRTVMALLWSVIAAAAVVFIYPLWPAVAYRLDPPNVSLPAVFAAPTTATTPNVQPITGNQLYIPSIGVDTSIVEGPSLAVLNKVEGIWHQTGGATNNLVLAGHRYKYLPPNTSTLYELNQVKVGDMIGLDWLGKRTTYKVVKTEVVSADDVGLINPTKTPQLTIYSCNDILMTHRVVVIARPIAQT